VAAAGTLSDLASSTGYHYRLTATNAAGVVYGADQTFTTAPPPSTPTTAAQSTPTRTVPSPTLGATRAFAGVLIVSRKLAFRGRYVAIRLRCPSGTAGRCIGRAKLTVRRRHGTHRIVLGQANFAIAPGRNATINVRVSRASWSLLRSAPRTRGQATLTAHTTTGQTRTTTAAVSITRRLGRK
jgi:hypothetical protein